jgi:GNAT superfamily N-acetyltransferase
MIDADPARLDLDLICAWLDGAYWSAGRPRAVIERSLRGSSPYGVYAPDGSQVALARVVTDEATFAWICDVYVAEPWRAKGVGRWLVAAIVERLRAGGVPRFLLATRDAHEVYARIGFEPLLVPGGWMEIDERPTRPRPADVRRPG